MRFVRIMNMLSVVCRIGSLEMVNLFSNTTNIVVCRIGSLEKEGRKRVGFDAVVCRIGSLEIQRQ